MKYKLVAVDMDGTLLNSNGKIGEDTINVIEKVIDKGILFVVASGRPIQGIKKYKNILNIKGPAITYNGAMIVSLENGEILYEQSLKKSDAEKILNIGNIKKITMCVWSKNQLYVNIINDKVNNYIKLSGVKPILISDYQELLKNPISKILWYDTVEKIEEVRKELSVDLFEEVTFCTSQPIFLEFFNSKVSKGKALEFIGKSYSISSQDMIAIGDGANDLSMIQYAGLGVAMGNASEEIKKYAKFITTSNDENGVGEVLDKFIFQD